MYYIVQQNVFKDEGYDQIFKVLDRLNLPYEKVAFARNSDHLIYHTERKDVFVYGSVKLAKVTSKLDWTPGSFYGGNHAFEAYSKGYGANVINHKSTLYKLIDAIDWDSYDSLFIKPSEDAKVFTGKVFNRHEWEDFVYNCLNDKQVSRVNENTSIQVSPTFKIIKEARVWIVGDEIVTSSYYKFHDGVSFEEELSTKGLQFAKDMAKLYQVADAYVMDIAETIEGWKIVEVNCINSAGFYKGDVMKIVSSLEEFYK